MHLENKVDVSLTVKCSLNCAGSSLQKTEQQILLSSFLLLYVQLASTEFLLPQLLRQATEALTFHTLIFNRLTFSDGGT